MAPEVVAKISAIRHKMVEGTATLDELKEAVALMLSDRKTATSSSGTPNARRAKAKAEIKSADEMLDELGNI